MSHEVEADLSGSPPSSLRGFVAPSLSSSHPPRRFDTQQIETVGEDPADEVAQPQAG